MECQPDDKRVVTHPKNEQFAHQKAAVWGLPVQVTSMCPPDAIYVLDPPRLFGGPDGKDERWPYSVGRIENIG